MHNYNNICFYDFETGSRKGHSTQPIQLAAVMIHARKLEIIPNSEFNTMIYAESNPEECAKAGLDVIEDEALAVNKKTREEVSKAPTLKAVWPQFIDYVNNYNYRKNNWSAPILAGFNNNGFDDIILDRICGPHGWNLGPWDKERNKNSLFHPIYNIDLFKILWGWFENTDEPKKLNMDSIRDFLGISSEGAHDALVDVKQGADILCRFLRLQRMLSTKVNWKNN